MKGVGCGSEGTPRVVPHWLAERGDHSCAVRDMLGTSPDADGWRVVE